MPNSTNTGDVAQTLDTQGRGLRRVRVRRFLYFLIILICIAAGVILTRPNDAAKAEQYQTQRVQRGDLKVTVTATGTLEPIKTVDVGIEVSGTIKTAEVDYNDTVKVGQVLARIDTSKLEAQSLQSEAALKSAKAKLLQAQASVEEAKAQMARLDDVKQKSDGKLPSKYEYDTQKAALSRAVADESSAKASVDQAQATLDANRSDLSKAVVVSPISGIVLDRQVEPGQTVAAQFQSPTLFTLAEDLTQMELQVDVDEADVGKVKIGQDATFTVDAYPDQEFPAQVTQVRFASETVEGVVTYKTILKVDNASLTLRPGMTATAVLTVEKREGAKLISNAALRFSPPATQVAQKSGGSLLSKIMPRPPSQQSTTRTAPPTTKEQDVWVLKGDQIAAVKISKGLSNGSMTEIESGDLNEGDEVVTDVIGSAS